MNDNSYGEYYHVTFCLIVGQIPAISVVVGSNTHHCNIDDVFKYEDK